MSTMDKIAVEISVMLGSSIMPVHQLLRMGRGAVIELETGADDDVDIYANDIKIARGQVVLKGERVSIQITEVLKRNPLFRYTPAVKKVAGGKD
ncbi:Flagellar motor switch protein FliN [Hartmannibacter diazotrophicus]|uniref:Flagellar motor switch protein FliN n=1 Tax=Hartmannibacter diazotrophicus TaxID=1482074 RepID=A0A2C9D804_9HYPH|nr:FliM/FliN family flagellar motor switch protein [Hartmannibacter diazotrophicus]SON56452.1 Flagellar motor switch protein FliN [Hartmannibacter diazotrophicus]